MKRASYREAVRWIALNDDPGSDASVDEVAGYISVLLIADIFAVEAEAVAKAVLRERRKNGG